MGTDDNPRAGRLEDDVLIWSILRDLEGLAVAAAVVADADAGDEHLLDLEWRRLEAAAQRKRLNVEDDDSEDERLYNLCFDLEEEIAKAPARSVAGVAAKIRVLHENHERGRDILTYEADCVRTALKALERLAGGAA